MAKPAKSEFSSDYIGYYINLVHADDPVKALENQYHANLKILKLLSEEQGNFAYAEGKWTLKEVIGHLMDSERVFAYRALAFARGEKQNLPSFDENSYVVEADFNRLSLTDIIHAYKATREANLVLFKTFSEETLSKMGKANGKSLSVRALLFMMAGHELHHFNVIRTKYLN